MRTKDANKILKRFFHDETHSIVTLTQINNEPILNCGKPYYKVFFTHGDIVIELMRNKVCKATKMNLADAESAFERIVAELEK